MAIAQSSSRITATSDDTSLYESVPLPLENRDAIRLLKVVNDNDGEPISCELYSASLNDPDLSYTALSYMWGEGDAGDIVIVNGVDIRIRPNLWEFLSQLRRDQAKGVYTESHLFWIDALCIDQSNIPERNHQVGMMSRIYSGAEKTVIWLGPASGLLDELLWALSRWQESGKVESKVPVGSCVGQLGGLLRRLYSHPYWRRAWIVQECVLAQHLKWQLGEAHTSVPSSSAIIRFSELVSEPGHQLSLANSVVWIVDLRDRWHNTAQRRYITPLSHFLPNLKCMDPRDRIYAMLSFMDPEFSISADYNKSSKQLFVELFDRCLNQFQEAHEVHWLAGTLDLDVGTDLKLPGGDWPTLFLLKYDEVVQRLVWHSREHRHRTPSISSTTQSLFTSLV